MRKRVRYTGRVQGVGFRATARGLARRHPLVGWVRNEPDGSVLLEVQGRPDDVDAFLVSLSGNMSRFIEAEDAADLPDTAPAAGEATFEILRT